MKTKWSFAVLVCICLLSMMGNVPVPGLAQGTDTQIDVGPQSVVGTGFTYQGQLKQSTAPFSGNCDFQFTLWDAPTAGSQVTDGVSKPNVAVNRGVFTVADISFGRTICPRCTTTPSTVQARWLQIAVRCPAGSGSYTTLAPTAGADGHSLCAQPPARRTGGRRRIRRAARQHRAESGEHEHNDRLHRRGWARSHVHRRTGELRYEAIAAKTGSAGISRATQVSPW